MIDSDLSFYARVKNISGISHRSRYMSTTGWWLLLPGEYANLGKHVAGAPVLYRIFFSGQKPDILN